MEGTNEPWSDSPTALESVWRYRWLVLGGTLLFAALGFALSAQQPTIYRSTAELFLSDPGSLEVFDQRGGVDLERYVPQQAERLASTPVLEAAATDLGGDLSVSDLRSQLEIDGDAQLGTLTVSVRAGDPQEAAAAANAIATAYQDNVRDAQLARAERAATELRTAEEDIEAQIGDLADDTTAGITAPGVQDRLGVLAQRLLEIDAIAQQLRVDARLFGSGVEFVEDAQPSDAPVAPTTRRTTAAAGLLGALLSAAAAYWLAGRGRRVASRDDPGHILGVPLLGVLPTYNVGGASSLRERTSLDPRTAEAYRFVQSSLLRLLRETGARSVLVTSAGPSTGKTETALQLSVTAVARGTAVLLVDADVRMRGLTNFLRADRTPGLLDLSGAEVASPLELVTSYPVEDGLDLSVLTAGTLAEGELAQIQESWFGHAIPELVDQFDLTVFDSSPLLAVADTATVAAYADAVVLVVREGSNLDDLARVGQRMRFVGQRLIGYIYLASDALDDTSFDYGLVRADVRLPSSRGRTDASSGSRGSAAVGRPDTGAEGHDAPGPVPRAGSRPSGPAASRPTRGSEGGEEANPASGDDLEHPRRTDVARFEARSPSSRSAGAGAEPDRTSGRDGSGATTARSDADAPFSDIVRHFGLDGPRSREVTDEGRRGDDAS